MKALGSSVNSARSRSYVGGYAPVEPGAIGPGRTATFEAKLTKGTLVAPVRSHSGFSIRVSLGIPQISLGGPVFLRLPGF
jgi:hypothetical protein